MKKIIVAISACLLLVYMLFSWAEQKNSQSGCSESVSNEAGDVDNPFNVTPFKLPKPWQKIACNYRLTWHRLTGYEFSGLHWKQFVSIYVNKEADVYKQNYLEYLRLYSDEDEDEEEDDSTLEAQFKNYSEGTIYLKENYLAADGRPGRPASLTLMVKRSPGYDPAGNDWEYIQFDPRGNVMMQGNSTNPIVKAACLDCHANMAERDYIFSTYFSPESNFE